MRLTSTLPLALSAVVLSSCGEGRTPIELGQVVSGVLTEDDSCWISCAAEKPGEPRDCNGGCSHRYQIEVTAGESYVVTFSPDSTPEVQFEDVEDGRLTNADRVSGNTANAGSSPATWVPVKTGTNRVGVYALVDFLPARYSVTVTRP